MDWYPDRDEDLLIRTPAVFATGLAPGVAGCRWFRDTERRDIQGELPCWPSSPTARPNGRSGRVGVRALDIVLLGIPLLLNVVANVGGAPGSPFGGDIPVRGRPEDPENELQDFPVMWAAPGTLARTVPWQLDPARRPKGYVTDVVLTSRRLLFLGSRVGTLDRADVLGEVPRDHVAGARRMAYSEAEADVRLTFSDRSWVRLSAGHRDNAERLCRLFTGSGGVVDSPGGPRHGA